MPSTPDDIVKDECGAAAAPAGLRALEEALDAIFSYSTIRGLVVDVRINAGGSDPYGLALASPLANTAQASSRTGPPINTAPYVRPEDRTLISSIAPICAWVGRMAPGQGAESRCRV